ncbi:hypothetical protein TNCV_4013501 [Trichonephila clavipes]|nr:hypothetical protein TNCV_4013501 [Trichonephila clavipes]
MEDGIVRENGDADINSEINFGNGSGESFSKHDIGGSGSASQTFNPLRDSPSFGEVPQTFIVGRGRLFLEMLSAAMNVRI